MTSSPAFHGMVLSAGFGTRLAPLTDEIPKPLVPIGGEPLLGRSLRTLKDAGAARLVVNTHHHCDQVRSFVEGMAFPVEVSHEESILGTAGGIARARERLKGKPVIVVNGDIVGALPVVQFLQAATPGLCLAVTPKEVGQGTVGLGEDGSVVRLRGETFGRELTSGDYMGAAHLGENCLATLPDEGCLIGDWALPQLRDGAPQSVRALIVDQDFEDVGNPTDYLNANLNWLSGKQASPTASHVGEGATIEEGVQVVASVIGAGAQIKGQGRVVASLVLPGAVAVAPLSDSIVTPSGQVIDAS